MWQPASRGTRYRVTRRTGPQLTSVARHATRTYRASLVIVRICSDNLSWGLYSDANVCPTLCSLVYSDVAV
jgi:hypothetical protein